MKKWMIVLVGMLLLMVGVFTITATAVDIVASGNCGNYSEVANVNLHQYPDSNVTWMLDSDGLLTISGAGNMYLFSSYTPAPWLRYKNNIKSVIIEDGVLSIGNRAFSGCSELESATIPDGITCISFFAFEGCSNLKSVNIPDSVTVIGENAFAECVNLESLVIPTTYK